MHLLRTLARGGVTPVVRRTVPIAAPAADTGITITPDNGRAWQIMSIRQSLVTSSHAANRNVTLTLNDGNVDLWSIPSTAVQAASLTVIYSWIADYWPVNTTISGGRLAVGIPPAILLPDWTLKVGFVNDDTADQLGVTTVEVLEAFTGRTEAEYDLARSIAHHADAIGELLTGEVVDV